MACILTNSVGEQIEVQSIQEVSALDVPFSLDNIVQIHKLTQEQLREDKDVPFEDLKGQFSKADINRLKKIRTSADGITRYYDTFTGGYVLYRSTDANEYKYNKRLSETEIINKLNSEPTKEQREEGTIRHEALKELLMNYDEVYANNENKRKKAQDNKDKVLQEIKDKIGEEEFDVLVKGSEEIKEQIKNKKKKIYDKVYESAIASNLSEKQAKEKAFEMSKTKIMPEFMIYDPSKKMSGTMDLVVFFGDGSASIYDHKFKDLIYYSEDGNQRFKSINQSNMIDFDTQMGNYKKMLSSVYGINKFNQSRILLYATNINEKTGKMSDTVLQTPIAVANEMSDLADSIANRQVDEAIEQLRNQKKKLVQNKTGDAIVNEINSSINEILVKGNLEGTLINVAESMQDFEKNSDKFNVSDIQDRLETMDVYKNVLERLRGVYVNSAKTKEEKANRENELIRTLNQITSATNILQQKLITQLTELASDEGVGRDILKHDRKVDFIDSWLTSMSKLTHPIIRLVSKKIEEANRLILNKTEELKYKTRELSLPSYDKLIDKESGNLISKYDKKYYDELAIKGMSNSQSSRQWLKDNFEFDQERFSKFIKKRKETWKRFGYGETMIEKNSMDLRNKFDLSLNTRGKPNFPSAWKHSVENGYFRFAKTPSDNWLSKEYESLDSKEKEFYDYYSNKMSEYRSYLFTRDVNIKNGFIPAISDTVLMHVLKNKGINPTTLGANFINSLTIKEGDEIGAFDPVTGKPLPKLPVYYTNDSALMGEPKSNDLAKSLYLFGTMVENHIEKSKIENEVRAAKYIYSNFIKTYDQDPTQLSSSNDNMEVLDNFVMSKFYGQRLVQKDKTYDVDKLPNWVISTMASVSGKDTEELRDAKISLASSVASILKYTSLKNLGLSPLVTGAAIFNNNVNAYIMGVEGRFYTKAQFLTATKQEVLGDVNYKTIQEVFDVASDKFWKAANIEKESILSRNEKYLNNIAYVGLQATERHMSKGVLGAMLMNHTIDSEGNIRVKRENELSITDNLELKDGKLIFKEGFHKGKDLKEIVNDKDFYKFRRKIEKVVGQITGSVSEQDRMLYSNTILGMVVGQYRNWIPGIVGARLGMLTVDSTTGIVEKGRYRVLLNEMEDNFRTSIGGGFERSISNLGSLLIDGLSMGILHKHKPNDKAITVRYEKELQNLMEKYNYSTTQELKDADLWFSKEDFLAMYQGRLRSAAMEFAIIAYMVSLLAAIGYAEDEDDPMKVTKYILNRLIKELAFTIDPSQTVNLFNSPAAIVSDLIAVGSTFTNSIDEARDLVYGENDSNDQTPMFHYTNKWIPFISQIPKTLDFFSIDVLTEEQRRDVKPKEGEKGVQLVRKIKD